MRMRMTLGAAIIGMTLVAGALEAADKVSEKKFKVQVVISGDDDVKTSLASLLQEEFRALKDVELVAEKPGWTVEVLGVAPRNEKKEPVLFLVSVMVTQNFLPEYWNGVYETLAESVLRRQHEMKDKSGKPFVLDKKKIEDLRAAWTGNAPRVVLDAATENLARKHAHYLKGGNDLRALTKEIVTNFDQGQLGPQRKK